MRRSRWIAILLCCCLGCAAPDAPGQASAALTEEGVGLGDACLAAPSPGGCCAPDQLVEEGTPAPDAFVHDPSDATARCSFGYASRDLVRAGSAADTILLGPDGDFAEGRDGDDRIAGGPGHDELHGDGGDDWIAGEGGDDRIYGERGQDELLGGDGKDRILGGAEDDRLLGGAGDDVLFGENGDDWILPGEGRDQVDAGEGDDVIVAYHACELVAGETILGGPGFDRFFSPLSRARLAALGVTVEVEAIVEIPPSCLSSCGGECGEPQASDFTRGCEATCQSVVACTRFDALELPTVAECQASCAETVAPPAGCDARAVLDAQIACLTGSCEDLSTCEVPSCE
jgi:Ca2+-binding RTX toxin-like protein